MSKVFYDVRAFMNAAGQDCPLQPSERNELSDLYKNLIAEEFAEFIDAYQKNNAAEELDACFDMIWVIVGYMHSRGWSASDAWDEGSKSNLAKIDSATGKVIRREDGKILKPEGWQKPNFGKFV